MNQNIRKVGRIFFIAGGRYGYGAVDQANYEDFDRCGGLDRTVFAGRWLTQKAARWIADELNAAYRAGYEHGNEDSSKASRDVDTASSEELEAAGEVYDAIS